MGYCYWWEIPSDNLFFVKRILGFLGVEPRSIGIPLADGHCHWGRGIYFG
jgi:hypothetical protein